MPAPGLDRTLAITGSSSFSFSLPPQMASGSYAVQWKLGALNGSCWFDVVGYAAKMMECLLDKDSYAPSDLMNVSLTVRAGRQISGVMKGWVVDPQGIYHACLDTNLNLEAGDNALQFPAELRTVLAGTHQLVYALYVKDQDIMLDWGQESQEYHWLSQIMLSQNQIYHTDLYPFLQTGHPGREIHMRS